MGASEEAEYRYTIPLESVDGVERPAYTIGDTAEQLDVTYESTEYVVTTASAVPHFHTASVNVEVEELGEEGGE